MRFGVRDENGEPLSRKGHQEIQEPPFPPAQGPFPGCAVLTKWFSSIFWMRLRHDAVSP